ncbi:metallophosphoesterase [Neobacillus sp. YIM B06451]|uniref:metallophosphoesterase n=1 Tax=Neobacillus sp. YIM B06451 TaxID=3070994 RepID=UPI00292E4AD6|nr:metallophosphoesterase [Neobacillus sp. YIM B06451]
MKIFKKNHSFALIIIVFTLITYTFVDNQRIKIAKQEVVIGHLPKELNGFTILQISDLHEKEFGKDQVRLIKKINTLSYDAIVFTGDMLKNSESTNYKPFYDLLDGIDNKETALFVPGNTDPESYDNFNHKTDFVVGIEQRGVKLLESNYRVEKNTGKVIFVSFENALEGSSESKDVLIGLTHYPVVDAKIDFIFSKPNHIVRDLDLLMAGHYHGGQIRLPLFGAIFIPEGSYPMDGLFPPQDRVKGLWEYRKIKQYVSTGLGSSDAIPLLDFRYFNTPEINLLILRGPK